MLCLYVPTFYTFDILCFFITADHGSYGLDMGALWIHGIEGNPVYEYVKQEDIELGREDERSLSDSSDSSDDDEDELPFSR